MRRSPSKLGENRPLDRERAYEFLFRKRTFALVWYWLERLGVPLRDRRDVTQEVFLSAHQSFHTYDPMRSRPERWLNKITVHSSAHYKDRAQHRREELATEDFFEVVDEEPGPDEQMASEQERLEVVDVIQTLEPDLRSVLLSHDIDGIPMAEIAEQHGIPLSTAYKWRARALQALQVALEERRREERQRSGGMVLLPLNAEALLALWREIPDGPEDVRIEVMGRVREALQGAPIDAGGEASGGWAHGKVAGSQLSASGPGIAAPVAGGATAIAAVGAAIWLSIGAAPAWVATARPVAMPATVLEAVRAAPEPDAAPPTAEVAPPPAPVVRAHATREVRRATPRDTGELEVRRVDACRRELNGGNAQGALSCLAQYEREVPAPLFDREKRLLRVRALVASGAREAARREARRLVALHPSAAQIPELRDLL